MINWVDPHQPHSWEESQDALPHSAKCLSKLQVRRTMVHSGITVYDSDHHLYSPAFMDLILTLHLTKELTKLRLVFVHSLLAF